MHCNTTTAPLPGEAAVATLPQFHLLAAVFACLAACFFLVAAPINPQFDVRRANSAHANLLSRWTAPDPGQPHSLFVPNVTTLAALNAAAAPDSPGVLNGKVTFEGTPKKYKPIDMSAEPNCAKYYTTSPMPEISVTGPDNSLQNVIVYISEGAPDENFAGPVVHINQRGCRYTPHIVSAQTNQEIWVKNDDTVTHSVHPMAHVNAEWNRSQPPGTPPVVIRYDHAEFIKVKCELHPWMRGVLAVFKNSHHAMTDSNGAFTLPNLPPGKYTVTAWHELYGTQSKEITISAGANKDLNFVFKVTPY